MSKIKNIYIQALLLSKKNIEFKEKLENNYKEKEKLKKELEEIDKKIKEVSFYVKGNNKENILKVREKYIYIYYIIIIHFLEEFLKKIKEQIKIIMINVFLMLKKKYYR